MRYFSILLALIFTMGIASADLFFQNNNPFPNQVQQQNLNNIYETAPAVIEQEKETAKKVKKSRWWDVKNDEEAQPIREPKRAEDSGFIIFK